MSDEEREVAGVPVVITKPAGRPTGITFLLTAANLSLSKYDSIKRAILSNDQIFVGFYINALRPLRRNHRVKAENVHDIYTILKSDFRVSTYNIVGHSVGGKIALLVAALHDKDQELNSVVALDPVDQTPVEFTKREVDQNLSLKDSMADITLTVTESGFFVSEEHNGRAIYKLNQNVNLVMHRNAGHMAYCDDDGQISWKAAMGTGNPERNAKAKKEALDLVKGKSKGNVGGKTLRGVKKLVKDTKAAAKEMTEDATSSAKTAGSGMFMKGMMGGML